MGELIPRILRFAREAWRELPFETGAVAVAAVSLMAATESLSSASETWLARLFLAAVLVTPLLFSLTLLARAGRIGRGAHRVLGAAVAAGVLGAMVAGLDHVNDIDVDAFAWPLGLAVVAALLTPFVVVAAVAPADRFGAFAGFLRRFCEQTTTVAILCAAALAAAGIVFLALDELFDLRIDKLALDSCIAIIAVFTVGYLYRMLAVDQGDRMPAFWRQLVTGVGVPFVAAMLFILTIYELYVLTARELPRNLLSPLIIAAGAVGFLCTLIIAAILRDEVPRGVLAPAEPHRWTKRLSIRLVRAFPLVLLVLLPMAGWALAVRVEQYGFTPFRVVRMLALACLGVLSLLGAIRYLRGRRALAWEVPLCGIVFSLAGAWGPLGAVHRSLESQVPRLEQMLAAAGVEAREVHGQAPEERVRVIPDKYWEMQYQIQLVAELGGEAALRRVLTGEVDTCAKRWMGDTCLERLGVIRDDDRWPRYIHAKAAGRFPVPAGDLEFVHLRDGVTAQVAGCTLRLEGDEVRCYDGSERLGAASLAELVAEGKRSERLPPAPLAVRSEDGRALGLLVVRKLELYRDAQASVEITELRGLWMQRP